ncbi:MAG TPA: beta-galactosidase, partial [Microbacterium sp.]|nr:beta-galactosidase [Microbacterium sp.]
MTAPRWRIADGQLLLDDRPVLLLGGQLHNSTSSSIGGIAQGLRHVRDVGGNTVVAPVCWDLSEAVEGEFDFSLVDALLIEADANDLRLVLLWFGAFKNAGSTYAPRWVRADTGRFPRARTAGAVRPAFTYEGQTPPPVLSVFSTALREADARAFEALLTFVAGHPLRDRVAMVQIENEVGLLADSRDRSELAEAAWRAQVPDGFIAFLESASGSIAAGL